MSSRSIVLVAFIAVAALGVSLWHPWRGTPRIDSVPANVADDTATSAATPPPVDSAPTAIRTEPSPAEPGEAASNPVEALLNAAASDSAAVEKSHEQKLKQASRALASGYEPNPALIDAEARAAVAEALKSTDQQYADASALVVSTRTALLDRFVAEGRYLAEDALTPESELATKSAFVNATRVLSNGKRINILVKRGEGPELEEAVQLHRKILLERDTVALDILKQKYPPVTPAKPGEHR